MRTLAQTSFPVDQDAVAQALGWLESAGQKLQWPARTRFKLQLCLDETLTNVTLYGFPADRPAHEPACVRLALRQEGQRLNLVIADNGVAFDPTAQSSRPLDASLDDATIGGHGLRLMRHYLEDIRYERRDGWNHLELIAMLDDA